ncbi:hypothetical protein ACF0H5_015946 [Mactra antiquata]
MDDVDWSEWSDSTEEWCSQNSFRHQVDFEDETYLSDTVNDIDSITSLICYEETYAGLMKSFIEQIDQSRIISGSEDDFDNLPLAEWINRIIDEGNDDYTYQDKSQDYTIIIEEQNNTHTSCDIPTSSQQALQGDKIPIRDKGWKRRGKHIKRKQHMKSKRVCLEKNGDEDNDKFDSESSDEKNESDNDEDMATAKFIQQSIREKRSQEKVLWYHTKRLDKLLASNMLKRKEIPGDGNCLLSAVLHYMGWPMSTPDLRLKIAQHITDNITDYISFVTFEDNLTEEEELKTFNDMIEEIKQDGKWNTYMSDFVPLCIANIFQRTMRIFSSRPFQPILDIKPHVSTLDVTLPIVVAHIAIDDKDHYDAVESKARRNNDDAGDCWSSIENEQESLV